MKYLMIALLLCASALYAFDVVDVTPTEPNATWAKDITVKAGETINLVAIKLEYVNAWAAITGRVKINNDIESTYVTWQPNSTCVIVAITDAVLHIEGN